MSVWAFLLSNILRLPFKCWSASSVLILPLFFAQLCFASNDLNIIVKGLFTNNAVVIVDGQQRLLKKGKPSPEGIVLLSANSQEAKIRYNGKIHTLNLSKDIGSSYAKPTKKEVRLQRGDGGHYFSPGFINGRQTNFMVDTGASAVALSSNDADSLGVKYKKGQKIRVNTASGISDAYEVTLKSVGIGGIQVNNVRAMVVDGQFPIHILLGNSFLSEIEMKVDQGVLVLQKNFE